MKQSPLGCGERRSAGAHNSPATLLHLPLHPYHFLTNTETLLTLSPVRTRSLPQPRWEKTWPHRAPSSRRAQARRDTKEGVRRAQKRMICLCGYQEAGCCLYPPSREKRGGLKTTAPAPQPANPARRWRQWPPPSPFPTSKLGSGTQAPSPNSAANSVSLTLTPRPPNPYAQELGGEG